jgi:hypothetical protein
MDYGKISAILTELYDNKEVFIEMGYVGESYFLYLDDALILATMVNADWAEPTDLGKEQIFIAWKTLCDIRELDHTVMYDKVVDFFMAQEVVG